MKSFTTKMLNLKSILREHFFCCLNHNQSQSHSAPTGLWCYHLRCDLFTYSITCSTHVLWTLRLGPWMMIWWRTFLKLTARNLKIDRVPKWHVIIFQPSIFRCVRFRGCKSEVNPPKSELNRGVKGWIITSCEGKNMEALSFIFETTLRSWFPIHFGTLGVCSWVFQNGSPRLMYR